MGKSGSDRRMTKWKWVLLVEREESLEYDFIKIFLPLKLVMDGFVGGLGTGEIERTTRRGDGRGQLKTENNWNKIDK